MLRVMPSPWIDQTSSPTEAGSFSSSLIAHAAAAHQVQPLGKLRRYSCLQQAPSQLPKGLLKGMAGWAEVIQLGAGVGAEAQGSPAPALSAGLEAALRPLGSMLLDKMGLPGLVLDEPSRRELPHLFCSILPPYFAPAAALAEHPAAATPYAIGLTLVSLHCNPREQRAAEALLDRLAAQADAVLAAAGPSG